MSLPGSAIPSRRSESGTDLTVRLSVGPPEARKAAAGHSVYWAAGVAGGRPGRAPEDRWVGGKPVHGWVRASVDLHLEDKLGRARLVLLLRGLGDFVPRGPAWPLVSRERCWPPPLAAPPAWPVR